MDLHPKRKQRGEKVESFDVRPHLFSTSNRIRRGRIRGEDASQMATFLGYLAKVVGNSERMNLLVQLKNISAVGT